MMHIVLLYLASVMLLFWGIAHLVVTESIVRGFGDISRDNARIITMEWIVEGVSLVFIAAVVIAAASIDRTSAVSRSLFWLCFIMLDTLSVISLLTGFKIKFLPFKLCPVIFTTASVLILLGGCF